MLELFWFGQKPWDFEHKNFLLLHYLSLVDESYSRKKLSPYLLWTEKLVIDIKMFNKNYGDFKNELKKDIIGFSWEGGIQYSEVEPLKEIGVILEIIDYALPQLEERIQVGYKLHKRFPQFLF